MLIAQVMAAQAQEQAEQAEAKLKATAKPQPQPQAPHPPSPPPHPLTARKSAKAAPEFTEVEEMRGGAARGLAFPRSSEGGKG